MSIRPLPGSELPPIPAPLSLYDSVSTRSVATPPLASPVATENPDFSRNRYSQSYLSPTLTSSTLPEIQTSDTLAMNSYLANNSRTSSMAGSTSDPFVSPMAMPTPLNVDVNEFGTYTSSGQFSPRTTSLRNLASAEQPTPGGPRGPRFATFPVKGAGTSRPQQPPPVSYTLPQGFGDRAPSLEIDRRETASFSSSVARALGEEWVSPGLPENVSSGSKMQEAQSGPRERWSGPPPRYTVTPELPPLPPQIPPPISQSVSTSTAPSNEPQSAVSEDDDAQLAYVGTEDEDHSPSRSSARMSGHGDRHVRFGADDGAETRSQEPSMDHSHTSHSHAQHESERTSQHGMCITMCSEDTVD